MSDVTASVRAFREAARHLWNTAFAPQATWDTRDDFDGICACLFQALVLRPHELWDRDLMPQAPLASPDAGLLRVVPQSATGMRIMINREPQQRSGYWDHPVAMVAAGQADLRFVQFFDWDELGARDFELVEVVIDRFDDHADLPGRSALVSVNDVRFLAVE